VFIEQWRAQYPLNTLCRVLEVSTSAYYSWQRRPLADHHVQDALLEQRIRELHQASKGRYGTPRLQAGLRAEGQRVSRQRISRLMRRNGLRAKGPRRFVRTTDSDHLLAVCPNLLNREFDVQDANTVWASDLTFIPTREGWLYLAVTLDLHSRAVVGHAMDSQMPATLPLTALQMAVSTRTPPSGLLHHSDRGSQYVSKVFQAELARIGAQGSMSRRGNCWDNSVLESFFSSLKRELFDGAPFESRAVARQAIFEYIEVFYNRRRRHSTLGYLTPLEFERQAQVA
jgi:putative transposase